MIITKENNIFLYFCKKTNMKQVKKIYDNTCFEVHGVSYQGT